MHRRVVIVDTSNEIGGDGDVPHPAIGGARRMQVPKNKSQADVMVCCPSTEQVVSACQYPNPVIIDVTVTDKAASTPTTSKAAQPLCFV